MVLSGDILVDLQAWPVCFANVETFTPSDALWTCRIWGQCYIPGGYNSCLLFGINLKRFCSLPSISGLCLSQGTIKKSCHTMIFASLYFNELLPVLISRAEKETNVTAPSEDSMKLQNADLGARASEARTAFPHAKESVTLTSGGLWVERRVSKCLSLHRNE